MTESQRSCNDNNNNNRHHVIVNRAIRLLNKELSAFPGGDAAIIILTTIATTLAYVGAMSLLINFMAADFTYLTTRVPNFDFQIVNGE